MKVLFIIALLVLGTGKAQALDAAVRRACTGDYFRFCGYTVPGSASCRACFRKSGPRLSPSCLAAIRNSSEFAADYARGERRYARGSQ